MLNYHTLRLEDSQGREVAKVKKVVSNDVRTVFYKLAKRAETIASPVIFLDGYGFTSKQEFDKMVRICNEVSTVHGGRQIW